MILYYLQIDKSPPMHMSICKGPIVCKKTNSLSNFNLLDITKSIICVLCAQNSSTNNLLICLNPNCQAVTHIMCLAQRFLASSDHIIPVDGECPACGIRVLWNDLIRKKDGCYTNLNNTNT